MVVVVVAAVVVNTSYVELCEFWYQFVAGVRTKMSHTDTNPSPAPSALRRRVAVSGPIEAERIVCQCTTSGPILATETPAAE